MENSDHWPALHSYTATGFAHLGMGLSGRALFGGASTYQVDVNWPWITANHLSLELFSGHILRDDSLRDFGETSDELTSWVGTFIGRNWRARGGLSYLGMGADRDGVTLSPTKTDTLIRLGAGVGLDTRDNWRNPHRGWHLSLSSARHLELWSTNDLNVRLVTRPEPGRVLHASLERTRVVARFC